MPTPASTGTPSPSTRRTVMVMYAGLALSLIAILVPIVDQATGDSLAGYMRESYPDYKSSMIDSDRSAILTILFAIGGTGIVLWLLMARAVRRGKCWARPVSTAVFVLATCVACYVVGGRQYGRPVLPVALSIPSALPCLAGLVAVALLWRRERDSARE